MCRITFALAFATLASLLMSSLPFGYAPVLRGRLTEHLLDRWSNDRIRYPESQGAARLHRRCDAARFADAARRNALILASGLRRCTAPERASSLIGNYPDSQRGLD
jgi:hypothetical protein